MAQQESKGGVRELKLKLTDEQRREIVKYIAETGNARLDIDLHYEDVKSEAIAPTSVLVGNAI
jgi:hypothetical protein